MAKYDNEPRILGLGAKFRDHCLIEQKSILTGELLWTPERFDELVEHYVENLDDSNRGFDVKLKDQLAGTSSGAQQLFAELYILDLLVLGNVLPSTKIKKITAILDMCEPPISLTEEVREVFENGGVLNGGQGYNNARFRQFWYLVTLGAAFSRLTLEERRGALGSTDAIEKTVYQLVDRREPQIQKALCYLFDPLNHEPVTAQTHLDKICQHFDQLLTVEQRTYMPQRRAAAIRDILREERDNSDWHFYIEREEWDPDVADPALEPTNQFDSDELDPELPETAGLRLFPVGTADELHVDQSWLDRFHRVLAERRQVILQGPPGTGKTFLARRLAKKLTMSDDRNVLVQFHPAYSYEDFFEGFRPVVNEDGTSTLQLRHGPLRALADAAEESPERSFILIIDEINRGNLARIFGELYFLLEYRDHTVELMYSREQFTVPKNLYIIGTMNTADRSIALVDSAMRRRFAFFDLRPDKAPTSDLLARWCRKKGYDDEVVDIWSELNNRIGDPTRAIGPSYFMRESIFRQGGLEELWETDILPQLEETFYGDGERVRRDFSLASLRAGVGSISPADE